MPPKSLLACLSLSVVLVCGSLRAGEVVFEENIEYANPDDQHLHLNLARPKQADGKCPAVVCIHGGGWVGGDRSRWNSFCHKLAERGYVAVTITYRFAPKYPFPAAVHDAKAAVRWLRANAEKYAIDPDRIGAMGDSAGGHLSQMLGVTGDVKQLEGDSGNAGPSSRIACVVNYYGPGDLTRLKTDLADGLVEQFMGGDFEHHRQNYFLASPLNWITPAAAPTLLIHGTRDNIVPYEQSVVLNDRLKAADVEVQLLTIEGGGHGFGGKQAEEAEQATLDWLDKHLKPAGAN